ncbi:MAG: 50S ribosomal protein L15 [Candidatus Omnitrophota bacterium]
MKLNDIVLKKGANKRNKRVGRGMGSGHGKTSGRGHKGAKARSGPGTWAGFEGGQMTLGRRIPKRGFNSRNRQKEQIVNVYQLNRFKKDSNITIQMLKDEGLIKDINLPVKILAAGEITKALNLQAHAASRQAKEKLEKAAGKLELIKLKKE